MLLCQINVSGSKKSFLFFFFITTYEQIKRQQNFQVLLNFIASFSLEQGRCRKKPITPSSF